MSRSDSPAKREATVRPRAAAPRKKDRTDQVAKVELVNTGTTPVAYDLEGHTIGGGERVEIDSPDKVALAAVDRGYLRAQQGEDWLVVRDGELTPEDQPENPEPSGTPADAKPLPEPDEAPQPVSGASNADDQRTEG